MKGLGCDIAIIGGGLAGGLAALALARARPDLTVLLVEEGETPGGNHRWSWFASDLQGDKQGDLPDAGETLVSAVDQAQWQAGYDVAFPRIRRTLPSRYRSIASADFAAALQREMPHGTLLTGARATRLHEGGVELADGTSLSARQVIDARGLAGAAELTGGWQVFMGRTLRLHRPHGLTRPTIMDATVEQIGGYRFVYVLPLDAHTVFIEDTYYQDTPLLDRAALSARLDAYAAQHGWQGENMGEETGVLPVVTGGDFGAFQARHRVPGVAVIGARGGFVHPLTSYTLPFAVRTALAIADGADLPGAALASLMEQRARDHWRATRFYRLLGTMLFGAADPAQRWRVFARFYGLPAPLIERFYAGRSTFADRMRILCGRPPVPVRRAIVALSSSQPPLKAAA